MRRTSVAAAVLLAGMATAAPASTANWNTHVEVIDGAHVIGNPEAERKLVEFVSYTCPHCGTFARTGDEILKLAEVGPGKLRLEIRHFVRDPVDLSVALLTWCGDTAKFPLNHAAFMHRQETWLTKAGNTTQAQQQRWYTGAWPTRARAIASDLDFYSIMAGRGYERVEVDTCLADVNLAMQLSSNSERDAQAFNIPGTPSFVLDGELLSGVHTWQDLEPRLAEQKSSDSGTN